MAGKDNCTTAAHGGTLFGSETANAANIPAKRGSRSGHATGAFPAGTSYLVHIQGDCMANQIPDGCYVAVKRVEAWPRPGTIGILLINDGEMVCKQYLKNERRKDSEVVEQIAPLYQFDRRYLLSSARRSHYVRKKNASYFLQ